VREREREGQGEGSWRGWRSVGGARRSGRLEPSMAMQAWLCHIREYTGYTTAKEKWADLCDSTHHRCWLLHANAVFAGWDSLADTDDDRGRTSTATTTTSTATTTTSTATTATADPNANLPVAPASHIRVFDVAAISFVSASSSDVLLVYQASIEVYKVVV